MKSNIRAQIARSQRNSSPVVLVHGLFGSPDNLGVLAHDLVNDHDIIQVNIRNHGLSPRDPVVNYPAMAQDPVDTLGAQQIDKVAFIGYSTGGRAVIALTALAPDRTDKLVVIDITPVDYHVRRHNEIFAVINTVSESDTRTHQQAAAVMHRHLNEEGVIQLLLKSFVDEEWRFNAPVLRDQYPHIVGWEETSAWGHSILFIPGGNSSCVSEQYRDSLLAQFPQARAHVIAGADHWVRVEKSDAVLCATRRYLNG